MPRVSLTRTLLGLLAALALAGPALAQSLDIRSPTPLHPGQNKGTIDNQVGSQFWVFHTGAGAGTITVSFVSMGLFGNPMAATIDVVLHDGSGKVIAQRTLTSVGKVAQFSWPGTFAKPGVTIVEIRTENSNLVRNGGDYAIEVSGPAIAWGGGAGAGPNPAEIAGSYAVMVCPPDFQCDGLAIHFAPDGSVATTDGHAGRWTLFDPDSRIYSVVIGRDRWTLQLVPGRGLVDTHDRSVVVFQAIRPR